MATTSETNSRIGIREAVLVRLAAKQEAVLAHAVGERLPDGVAQQHEAGGLRVEPGVASALVVRLGAVHPEALPRGRGLAVKLEDPQPQASGREKRARGVALEGMAATGEDGGGPAPAQLVEPDECLEVAVEAVLVGEPVPKRVPLGQPPLAGPHLLSEVPAARGEELIPAPPVRPQDGCGRALDDRPAQNLLPLIGGGQALGDEEARCRPRRARHPAQRLRRERERLGCAHRSEQVGRAVPDEPQGGKPGVPGAVQREQRLRIRIRATPDHPERIVRSEVTPPCGCPLPGQERVAGPRTETLPGLAELLDVGAQAA